MDNNLSLIHQTKNRARFKFDFLKHKNLDLDLLKIYLEDISGIKAVKINAKIHTIAIWHNLEIKDLERILKELKLNSFSKIYNFNPKDEPSLKGVITSLSGVVASSLIPNENAKLAISSLASMPMLSDGVKEFFSEGITSRVLESLAVFISIYRKDYLAANITNAMVEFGEYIEQSTVYKSDELIKELAKPTIKELWIEVRENGVISQKLIEAKDVKIGDIVIVGTGDIIGVDGTIISGVASINQVSMTGEAEPIKKERGDRVISGSIVEDGKIKIWAEQVGENTATARVKNYIESSLNEKSSLQMRASELADKLVPVTLGLAGVSYLLTRDIEKVASVLQADYSCALKLATPVAFKSSISKAGKNGIMIKGAKSIEALSEVDTFVFDKTGTLTSGKLEVLSVSSFNEAWSEERILNLTASAEEHYFHPVAEAIVNAAKKRDFVHIHHDEVEFIVAHGVKTEVNGKSVVIGSRHFLEDDEKISFKKYEIEIKKELSDGKTLLYVGYDGELLGTIGLTDKLRVNAKKSIERLREAGVKSVVMLTGDVKDKAKLIADELGVDEVYSELLPTDKASIIKKLISENKKVAFVGDGINDAPALISANVGISMQKGADIAKASADVSLLRDDIEAVAELKELSNQTMKLIKSNFNITVGVNSAILTMATLGLLSPISTAILHNGTTIGLLLNSMNGVKISK